jgi:hypothetical protein
MVLPVTVNVFAPQKRNIQAFAWGLYCKPFLGPAS